jgi:transposase
MTKVHQFVDFANNQIFVGIDVHKKSWSVSLYHEQKYLRTFTQPPSVEALEKFLRRDFPNADYQCGYESGFCGFWIQREFEKKGIKCKVVHPADIPRSQKYKTAKTDKIDSKSIAQALSSGTVTSVYIPDQETESYRSLLRQRNRLQGDLRRCKQRIKSLLCQFGLPVPECFSKSWSQKFIVWLKTFAIEQSVTRITLNHMIEQMELLRGSFLKINKDIRQLQMKGNNQSLMTNLTSVPGVGPLTALTLITEIVDIRRFNSFRQLNSFVGLYPMEHSSGDHEHKGNITIRQNKWLRRLLIESAWTAIRHDPALLLTYQEWKKRMTPKRAIIKVARKLLSRIRYVWLHETTYEKGLIK